MVGAGICREAPSSDREYLDRTLGPHEFSEFKIAEIVSDLNLKIVCQCSEREEEVCVCRSIDLGSRLIQAITAQVVALEEGYLSKRSRRLATYDVGATIGDAAVRAWCSRAWRASTGVSAKVGSVSTLYQISSRQCGEQFDNEVLPGPRYRNKHSVDRG
jgi:hypothetical protein